MVKEAVNIRTGENIRKRKDGRWEGRYIVDYANGKARYKSIYGNSYMQVKKEMRQIVNYKIANPPCNMTLEQAVIEWLEIIKVKVKESTYPKYYDIAYQRIIPKLGKIKLNKITNEDINTFIIEQLNNGRLDGKQGALSPKTVDDIGSILGQVLAYANAQGYTKNTISILRLHQDEPEHNILSKEQSVYLKQSLLLSPNHKKLGILICLLTGIRVGELCGLRLSDFDFEQRVFRINRTLQRIKDTDINAPTRTKIIIDTPKSLKSNRIIPIPMLVIQLIKELNFSDSNAYILTGTAAKYMEPRTFSNVFKKYLVDIGLPNINVHALRHSFASIAINEGFFTIKDLSEILGHASEQFTISKYVHSNMQQKRKSIERYASL